MQNNVFEYITTEANNYQTQSVPIQDGWEWSMKEHIRKSMLYKNSKFTKGKNDGSRPFKNIIRPILNVAYRSEGFDVKDIEPFVNDDRFYYKSFLVRKYHPKWARRNDIDTFIDDVVESYCDYGLALVKNVNNVRPEVVPLARLAFCDQTDILSGSICERHEYSIDQLMEMSGRWEEDKVKEAITQAKSEKSVSGTDQKAKTPGKYIEVFELHGTLPEKWLSRQESYKDKDTGEDVPGDEYSTSEKYTRQIQIVTYYINSEGTKTGICLFKGKEKKPIYKALVRDKIFGRACGFGGIEELFDPQTWTNYSEIKIKALLDAAALLFFTTTDEAFAEKNPNIADAEVGTVFDIEEGKSLDQKAVTPQNIEKFNAAVAKWEENAQKIGSANDPLLGASPNSGTPFKLQELVTVEGKGIHDYRRGKVATFIGEIYRDWTLEYLVSEMNDGQKFIEELSLEELQAVADNIATNYANDKLKKQMLPDNAADAKVMSQEEIDNLRTLVKDQFMKGGNKRFMEVMKKELESLPVDVEMNIAGKQKDLARNADKLTNIFRQIIAAPQVLQMPGMGKLFNEIIENSGFSPIDFTSFTQKLSTLAPAGGAGAAAEEEKLEPVVA
jgi:hypothetical protein